MAIIQGTTMTGMSKTTKDMMTKGTRTDMKTIIMEDFQVKVDTLGIRRIDHVNRSNDIRA